MKYSEYIVNLEHNSYLLQSAVPRMDYNWEALLRRTMTVWHVAALYSEVNAIYHKWEEE